MSARLSNRLRIATGAIGVAPTKSGFFPFAAFLLVGVCAPLAAAAEPVAGNVTRGGFTVFWESETEGSPEVRVYADSAGAEPLTDGVRREAFPQAEAPGAHLDVYQRAERRELREAQAERGLMAVRVGGLAADTVYYFEAGVRDESGVYQAIGDDLTEVRTAPATPFVADYRQVVVDFEDGAAGSVAVLRAPGTLAPLVAVVGDSAGGAARAWFALSGLLDEASGGAYVPDENWNFTVTHHPGGFEQPSMSGQAPYDGAFHIAGTTTLAFEMFVDVEIAEFVFDPIGDQMAGQPFAVTIVARDSAGGVAAGFSGTVELATNGELESGGSTGAFEGGVLDGHLVTIGNTGDFALNASHPASGTEGTSDPFAVMTDWENWLALNVDPEDLKDSLREQRLADPDGSGQPSLLRYAFDLPFDGYEPAPVERDTVDEDGERHLTVSFRRLQYAPDVRYVVMGSDDMNGWEIIDVVNPGSPEWVTVRDERPVSETDRRFMRVGLVGAHTYDFWRTGEFGLAALNDPTISGPEADPGDHGVTNLERYALGMGGPDPDLARLPERRLISENGADYQELVFERRAAGEDVLYRVEATSDFPNWETIEEFGPGSPVEMVVRDTQPVPESGYRFIRLTILEAEE